VLGRVGLAGQGDARRELVYEWMERWMEESTMSISTKAKLDPLTQIRLPDCAGQ